MPKPTNEDTSPPSTEPPADFSSSSENNPEEEATIQLTVRVLRQIYSDQNKDRIPQELRDILTRHAAEELAPPPPMSTLLSAARGGTKNTHAQIQQVTSGTSGVAGHHLGDQLTMQEVPQQRTQLINTTQRDAFQTTTDGAEC